MNNSTLSKDAAITWDEPTLVTNAIRCFLHHYPNSELVPLYKELMNKGNNECKDASEPKPQPRPARRRRAQTTT